MLEPRSIQASSKVDRVPSRLTEGMPALERGSLAPAQEWLSGPRCSPAASWTHSKSPG